MVARADCRVSVNAVYDPVAPFDHGPNGVPVWVQNTGIKVDPLKSCVDVSRIIEARLQQSFGHRLSDQLRYGFVAMVR